MTWVGNVERLRELVSAEPHLIAAGADVRAVSPFPTGNKRMDELLRLYGAR